MRPTDGIINYCYSSVASLSMSFTPLRPHSFATPVRDEMWAPERNFYHSDILSTTSNIPDNYVAEFHSNNRLKLNAYHQMHVLYRDNKTH
jgi:hypothetical protein